MNNRSLINDELRDIAPALVTELAVMPYTLPQHYFEHFADSVLELTTNNDNILQLNGWSKAMPYEVPDGYFQQFATSVLEKVKTQTDSSKENQAVIFSKEMPYEVPNGYFEQFADSVLQKVNEQSQSVPEGYFINFPEMMLNKVRKLETSNELDEVAPFLNQINKAPVQSVPAGYFENLPNVISAKTAELGTEEELENIAPLLNTISKQPVQYLPQGYFENLEPAFLKAKTEKVAAPVVSIKKKTSWLRYAAAASVAIMLSFGAYFIYNNQSKIVAPSIANQPTIKVINDELASLDATTIEKYLQNSNTTTTLAPVISSDELNESNSADLDDLLQDFTDQQLKKYIEETPDFSSINKS